jgi:hypothetical protein
MAYWEKGKGVWHINCHPTQERAQAATARAPSYTNTVRGKGAPSKTFGTWKLRPLRGSYARILLLLSIACIVAGFGSLGHASSLGPIVMSEPTTRTNTVCVPQTMTSRTYATSVTTTGTVTYVSTFTTSTVSTLGYAGASCPYGGEYFSAICTKLCGCQYDICVSFDYNCADDYPAVHAARTMVEAVRVTTTSTSYLQQTQTQTLDMTRVSTECGTTAETETRHVEAPNPSKGSFAGAGLFFITVGILGFSYGMWSSQKKR